ncbi:MAG: DUF2239 family protein [Luteimonas sp.]
MEISPQTRCTAFAGHHRIASGELRHVALLTRNALERSPHLAILVFDDHTGREIELDLRGTVADLMKRLDAPGAGMDVAAKAPAPAQRNGPGRPRLGVVAREVTLLPRHWQWLSAQPGGASVALRKLVEEARRTHAAGDRGRAAQESAYRFMSAIAGDAPGFEDAIRALFAADARRFEEHTAHWPDDVREHAQMLAADAFREA